MINVKTSADAQYEPNNPKFWEKAVEEHMEFSPNTDTDDDDSTLEPNPYIQFESPPDNVTIDKETENKYAAAVEEAIANAEMTPSAFDWSQEQ